MEDVKWLEVTLDTTEAELDALYERWEQLSEEAEG